MKKKPAGDKPTERQAPKETKNDDKLEVYVSRARNAFIASEYGRALNWALKALALEPGHQGIRALALECAGALQDMPTILFILGEMYRDGTLEVREDFLVVGRMAMLHQDYRLAEEVFQALLDDAASEEPRLKGRLTKAMLKEAKQTILLARIMAEEPHRGRLVPAGGPPPLPTVLKVKLVKTARAASAEAPAQASPARKKPEASAGVAPPQSRKKAPALAATPRRRAAPKPPAEKKTAARKKARAANGPVIGTAAPV